MAERSNGCSDETLLAPFAAKRRLRREMTEDYYWIGAEETISIFSNSWNDHNSFIYLSLFETHVGHMFNKLSYVCDDWKLFCELVSTNLLTRCE